MIAAKSTTLSNSTRKWNLRFHCHERKHALFILSCFSVWSWWLFELVLGILYAMYKCKCLQL